MNIFKQWLWPVSQQNYHASVQLYITDDLKIWYENKVVHEAALSVYLCSYHFFLCPL